MFSVTCLDLINRYPMVLIAVILEPFFAIGIGIYSGFHIKRKWYWGIMECVIFYALFKITEYCAIGVFVIMKFEIVVLCTLMILSLLAMFVTVIMRRKKPFLIRILLSFVLLIVVLLPLGVVLNKLYCPTYYKYPDYIIKELLPYWGDVESVFGGFDITGKSAYVAGRYGLFFYGGYYAYTDEQGNDWYYTIYYEEGPVREIFMEIH